MTTVALALGAVVLIGAIALLPVLVSFLNDLEAKVERLRAIVPSEHDLDAAGGLPTDPVAARAAAGARDDHTA